MLKRNIWLYVSTVMASSVLLSVPMSQLSSISATSRTLLIHLPIMLHRGTLLAELLHTHFQLAKNRELTMTSSRSTTTRTTRGTRQTSQPQDTWRRALMVAEGMQFIGVVLGIFGIFSVALGIFEVFILVCVLSFRYNSTYSNFADHLLSLRPF